MKKKGGKSWPRKRAWRLQLHGGRTQRPLSRYTGDLIYLGTVADTS